MKVAVESRDPSRLAVDVLALPVAALDGKRPRLSSRLRALDRALGGIVGPVVAGGDFRGGAEESLVLYRSARSGPRRVLLLGLGEAEKVGAETLRRAAGRAVGAANALGARTLGMPVPTSRRVAAAGASRALAEGAVLASFRSDVYQSPKPDARPRVARVSLAVEDSGDLRPARNAAGVGVVLAESQNLARRLSNEPANVLSPVALAREARRIAREAGLRCRVLEVPEMRRRRMGALLAVGQGSANPPRLVVLEHRPRRRARGVQTVCAVGKGITFDSGGVSIKPAAGMQDMKHDMSGAAAVLGLLRAAARLDLPVHLVGILAAAENMPGGRAYRPGDILTSMSGQTIEVQNTDAEGRLVLADALSFARSEFEPDAIVDLATLTGACVVALGNWSSGLFGNHDELGERLREAGEATGERVWPMPLWDEHREAMRSSIADLKNTGGREAGSCTAAAFLSCFVGDTPWAHLDIAGTAWTGKAGPYQPYGATGVGVRLLAELLLEWPRAGLD
jgi:leucyl aminopeptidase